jgi:hypothetical protein
VSDGGFSEEDLQRIETARDPAAVPELVRIIRDYQRALDSLRMSSDVARRDREELRVALLRCQEELRRSREG